MIFSTDFKIIDGLVRDTRKDHTTRDNARKDRDNKPCLFSQQARGGFL
jgi:hypothetical protein